GGKAVCNGLRRLLAFEVKSAPRKTLPIRPLDLPEEESAGGEAEMPAEADDTPPPPPRSIPIRHHDRLDSAGFITAPSRKTGLLLAESFADFVLPALTLLD